MLRRMHHVKEEPVWVTLIEASGEKRWNSEGGHSHWLRKLSFRRQRAEKKPLTLMI